jgi:hypothetical protein
MVAAESTEGSVSGLGGQTAQEEELKAYFESKSWYQDSIDGGYIGVYTFLP